MKRRLSKLYSAVIATGVVASLSSAVQAQIATLDKGHALLITNGLQQWGFASDSSYQLDYPTLQNANLTAVNWGFSGTRMGDLAPGNKWGKWTDWHYNGTTITPQTALTASENAHKADLITVQVGDEANQSDMETGTMTRDWFLAAGNGTATTADDVFPNALLYVNSFFINSDAGYANFLINANPDAISWDSYPFSNPAGQYITPTNWLSLGQHFRRHALGSYIGATNASPRPYGLYTQTYHDDFAVDPGEVQIRWQAFAAWTMGFTFTDSFIYLGGNNNFASSSGDPNGVYAHYKETARQSKNLGPALVRLISYGGGTSIVLGQNAGGGANSVPGNGWVNFSPNDAPPNQRFLQNISATNLGTKNGGHPGDVYVGFFNPLQLSYGDPAGTAYFMVTNGLGGDLTLPSGSADNTATVAETRQQLTLNFDFGSSGVSALQRLNRNTGLLDLINTSYSDGGNTIWTSLGGSLYRLQLTLDGGTGDLFKYYDGSPFVGIEPPPSTMYWDADGASAGNNTTTGAGLGGSGTWDSSSTKWYPGSGSDSKWSSGSLAIFHGPSGGTVTLSTPQSASSLTFKTNGYVLTGSTLTMTGQTIVTDANVSARIDAPIAGAFGIVKSGSGTLILGGANTYAGGTTVSAGTLSISADGNLGAVPTSLTTNISIGGGTLQLTSSFTINANRGVDLGAAGGTIDVSAPAAPTVTYSPTNGFRGGDLTKIGNGTFFASATTGGVNNLWTGNLIIKAGTWRIQASDGLPINPTTGGPRPAQVTLDGGTWQMGANINITQPNRGITVAAGGGTIDTQSFNLTWPGAMSGSVATAVLNKIGSGILRLNTAPTASNYPGIFNVNAGTLQFNGGTAMGDLASINVANTAGVSLLLTGNSETIGSLSGGGASGGNVTLNTFTLTTGGNGNSTTYSGVMSGAGGSLTKAGSGTMTLANLNTYTGATTVNAGKLVFAASHTTSSSLTIQSSADGEIAQNGSRVLKTPSLTITGTGQLNLTDNKLITQSPIGSLSGGTYTGVTGLIASGRNNTNWNGPGIITTMTAAAGSNYTSIGIAKGVEVKSASASMTATWAGQTITGTDVLVMYTYGGDANLDGKINVDDYIRIDSGIASGLSGWSNGDFNYDGKVNIDDYTTVIDMNIGTQGPAFSTAGAIEGAVIAVPEPACSAMIVLTAIGMTARRRRR